MNLPLADVALPRRLERPARFLWNPAVELRSPRRRQPVWVSIGYAGMDPGSRQMNCMATGVSRGIGRAVAAELAKRGMWYGAFPFAGGSADGGLP